MGLEGLEGKPGGTLRLEEPAYPLVILGPRGDLIAARHLSNLKAPFRPLVLRYQILELSLDGVTWNFRQRLGQVFQGKRFFCRIEQGLDAGSGLVPGEPGSRRPG